MKIDLKPLKNKKLIGSIIAAVLLVFGQTQLAALAPTLSELVCAPLGCDQVEGA